MRHIRTAHLPIKGGRINRHIGSIDKHHERHSNLNTLKETLGLLTIRPQNKPKHLEKKRKITFKI